MHDSIWAWVGFGVLIALMLALDLGLLNRKAHTVTYKAASIWSAVWVSLALIFCGGIFAGYIVEPAESHQRGLEFLTGYLIELSLSVDNLFVFLLIFSYFKVPSKYQHRVLFWGVMGALVMRMTMIFLGTALIERAGWVIYIFGAFLVYTGIKMFGDEGSEVNPEESAAVRFVTRFVPMSRHYDGEKFFTRVDGRLTGTLLLLVLVIVEVTDLVFAVDSIPAILAITNDRFILYTSNVFAILGLRSLYFLLAGVVEKFHYLRIGLAIVLTFIGLKMLLPLVTKAAALALGALGQQGLAQRVDHLEHIPIAVSLGVVAVVLTGSVVASLIWPRHIETHIEVELPPGFNTPFDDDQGRLGGDEREPPPAVTSSDSKL